MYKTRKWLIRVAVLIVAIGLLIWRYGFDLRPPGRPATLPAVAQKGADLFSGVIQADEVALSAEYGGRVAQVTVEEGETVRQGQVLVRLDTTLIDDQVAIAEAQLAVAQANLARLQAGARPGAIAVAAAQEEQAVAARDAARQALTDAQMLRQDPQELALQVAVARAQLTAAEARVRQAMALRDLAQTGVDSLEWAQGKVANWQLPVPAPEVPLSLQTAPYDYWRSWASLNAAVAARDGAKEQLAQLEAQLAAPQALVAQVDVASAALAQAEAGVEAARAQSAALRAGATPEELAAAQARVAQAAAARDALRVQRSRMRLIAPLEGVVLVRRIEPGEVATPGAPLLTLGSLQQVRLVLYVPEKDLGRVRVGQAARVSVDSYPGRLFVGQVVHIAERAEYTPRNVATQEERMNTFYAVRVRIDNPDGALKPGMPADAVLEP